MFKCTDCGQEYEIKPDYCECGNNIFQEILTSPSPAPKASPSLSAAALVVEKTRTDIPSLLIFLTCIILSILSLIFIGRDNGEKEETAVAERNQQILLELPSIDKLWIEKKSAPVAQLPISEPAPAAPVKKQEVSTALVKTAPVKTSPVVKQPAAAVTPAQVSPTPKEEKTQTVTTSMSEKQKEEIIKKLTTPKKIEKKPEPSKTVPEAKVEQPAESVVQAEPSKPFEVKPDPAALRRELAAYKIALRNKIASNINFAGIIGDGSCAVTFKLDSAGNLIERKFSVQSDNNSVNDVVYSAMMQNPSFSAPPGGYKNETLTLTVKMYGGNFTVTLK